MTTQTFPIAPGVRTHGTIVTPGTTVYNPPLSKLFIGTTGTLSVTLAGDSTAVALPNVPVGFVNDLAIVNVGTATTAGSIIGFS